MRQKPLYLLAILALALAASQALAAAPLAEKYLLDGKLVEGAKALQERLKDNPKDDQARFGLGVVQFLQTFEHLGASLHKYGLRTEKSILRVPAELKDVLPQNPHPATFTHQAADQILQTFVDDVVKAEATLAEVKDPDVKLQLHVMLIKIDPFGQGKPISANFLINDMADKMPEAIKKAEGLVVGFDRGDVSWLRGYCHILAACGELLLAVDGREVFERSAHLLFEKVDTPHTFLLEDRLSIGKNEDEEESQIWHLQVDGIAFLHQLTRLPIREPARVKAALEHLEAAVAQAKEMWKYILAETDDDNEWIPNPRQTGVLGVKVTQEMVDSWLATLDEAEQVLKGKTLIPFWRGKDATMGVNLRRVFTEPRTFEPIEWVQGTAATPYLEKGPTTKFADPRMWDRLTKAFGGPGNFVGFGFWFQ